ncbi:hypothetical protein D3C72_1958120 [compost metagenome]
MVVAFPWTVGAGLAARVGDLDAGHGAGCLDGFDDGHEGLRQVIVPDARAAGRDAAFGRHGRRFDDHQSRAATGHARVVRQMPVVGLAIDGHVLAHGRHGDAVAQGDAFEGIGLEEGGHGGLYVCWWKCGEELIR